MMQKFYNKVSTECYFGPERSGKLIKVLNNYKHMKNINIYLADIMLIISGFIVTITIVLLFLDRDNENRQFLFNTV